MRLIINENQKEKVNNLIYQTIDGMFDIDEMIPNDPEDYDYAPIQVMSPDYYIFFRIYMPEYWSDETNEGILRKKRSPVLQLEREYEDNLNSKFGSLWHDQMIMWVENNFPFLPKIKSVGF
jgi:hypothetical protein